MADPKSDALLKAATSGKADKIKQLLASGASIEATDVNRMTPIMLAAQHGHVDAFQALAHAGANLHALAFRQVDLLEAAAQGDKVEIVRFLLDRGLPVNGHWQPLNDTLKKMGHDTPLIRAADDGNVDVVRVLLEAGADRNAKYQGETALQMIKERLDDPDYEEFADEYQEIAKLLGASPTKSAKSPDAMKEVAAKFATNSRRPAYAKLVERLRSTCGDGRSWNPVADHGIRADNVVAFSLKNCKRQKTVDDLQKESFDAGCHLILSEPWSPGEDASLVLFPTDNKLAVVAVVGTEGANHGVKNSKLMSWLEVLDAENPFRLVVCNHESIGGAFIGPVKKAANLAERIVALCPDCIDDEIVDEEALALVIKKSKSFYMRWD